MSRSILTRDTLLTPDQAADLLQLAPETLRNWRTHGTGPDYIRINHNTVRYSVAAIDEWLQRAVVRSNA